MFSVLYNVVFDPFPYKNFQHSVIEDAVLLADSQKFRNAVVKAGFLLLRTRQIPHLEDPSRCKRMRSEFAWRSAPSTATC
jgi:hypothetical protein